MAALSDDGSRLIILLHYKWPLMRIYFDAQARRAATFTIYLAHGVIAPRRRNDDEN